MMLRLSITDMYRGARSLYRGGMTATIAGRPWLPRTRSLRAEITLLPPLTISDDLLVEAMDVVRDGFTTLENGRSPS